MIPVRAFAGRDVALFGLGGSGIATARALKAGGAHPVCWDDSPAGRARAEEAGLTVADLERRDWSTFAALVLAPGVPLTHPKPHRVVELAGLAGVEVIGDMELFARAVAAEPEHNRPTVIAITGTNGKSTTTMLIGHILARCGRDAQVGGNIGTPVLALDPMHSGAVYVLETSSYQLDLSTSLHPDVAVFLNLSPDHLDRHGSMEGYKAAKRRIFANQTAQDTAVIGVDDPHTQGIAAAMMGATPGSGPRVAPISASRVVGRGVHAVGGVLYDALDGRVHEVLDLTAARALIGRHNWQNAAAAFAAARAVGCEPSRARDALVSFPGLAHRMETVGFAGPVRFVNDSKATNANAARQALGSFETIYWIAGGQAKEGGVAELAPLMARVAKAYLIGEAAQDMAEELAGRVEVELCGTLQKAVALASADAAQVAGGDPVVLLSPACASFDQFANFEARGDAFRSLVLALPGARREAGEAVA